MIKDSLLIQSCPSLTAAHDPLTSQNGVLKRWIRQLHPNDVVAKSIYALPLLSHHRVFDHGPAETCGSGRQATTTTTTTHRPFPLLSENFPTQILRSALILSLTLNVYLTLTLTLTIILTLTLATVVLAQLIDRLGLTLTLTVSLLFLTS